MFLEICPLPLVRRGVRAVGCLDESYKNDAQVLEVMRDYPPLCDPLSKDRGVYTPHHIGGIGLRADGLVCLAFDTRCYTGVTYRRDGLGCFLLCVRDPYGRRRSSPPYLDAPRYKQGRVLEISPRLATQRANDAPV